MSEIKKCRAQDPSKCRYHGRQVAEVDGVNRVLDAVKGLKNYSVKEYHSDAASLIASTFRSRIDSDRMTEYRREELWEKMKESDETGSFGEHWLTDGVGSYKVYRDSTTGVYRVYDQNRAQNKVDVVASVNEALRTWGEQVARR